MYYSTCDFFEEIYSEIFKIILKIITFAIYLYKCNYHR